MTKEKWQHWRDVLTVIFDPNYWLQNYSLCPLWDAELNRLLDSGQIFSPSGSGDYSVNLGDYDVWVANHPYASFTVGNCRPRRLTIVRAARVLKSVGLMCGEQHRCSVRRSAATTVGATR